MSDTTPAVSVPPRPAVSVGVIWATVGACLLGILAATAFLAARPNPETVKGAVAIPGGPRVAKAQADPRLAPSALVGAELYRTEKCGGCHGASGEGDEFGPPLRASTLRARFPNVGMIAKFLKDPMAPVFADAPLWKKLRADYPKLRMAAVDLPDADLDRLARYLFDHIGE